MAPSHPFLLCLLLFAAICTAIPAAAAKSEFTSTVQAAYSEALKLRLNISRQQAANALAQNQNNLCALLVSNYPDALYLLFTEDRQQYEKLIARQENRLGRIRKIKEKSAYKRYAEAEVLLQLGFCKLRFGKEIQAAFDIKKAYALLQENQRLYPNFTPNLKSLGLLHVLIGSVPQKYQWLLSTFGFTGSTQLGKQELRQAATAKHPFKLEAGLTEALVLEYLFKEGPTGIDYFADLAQSQPNNLLFRFLYAAVLKKEKQTDAALEQLLTRPQTEDVVELPFAYSMIADLYLYKTEYAQATTYYHQFLDRHKGHGNIKRTYYHLYLAALLSGNKVNATHYRQKTLSEGYQYLEEDKFAHNTVLDNQRPNLTLLKTRLLSDGGFYEQALQSLGTFDVNRSKDQRQILEYYYRKGRLYHSLNQPAQAKAHYQRTIDLAGELPYYFAPNACLQLGYLYQEDGQAALARKYFNKALAYPSHEYKNSIDSKAKTALAGMG